VVVIDRWQAALDTAEITVNQDNLQPFVLRQEADGPATFDR